MKKRELVDVNESFSKRVIGCFGKYAYFFVFLHSNFLVFSHPCDQRVLQSNKLKFIFLAYFCKKPIQSASHVRDQSLKLEL